mmetsp:Transcript_7903/g.9509  ORF Transcript_7903/g.9509 Transcript_7903/m.9509 type:complete len:312 (-) Transcript_7903:1-936(-)
MAVAGPVLKVRYATPKEYITMSKKDTPVSTMSGGLPMVDIIERPDANSVPKTPMQIPNFVRLQISEPSSSLSVPQKVWKNLEDATITTKDAAQRVYHNVVLGGARLNTSVPRLASCAMLPTMYKIAMKAPQLEKYKLALATIISGLKDGSVVFVLSKETVSSRCPNPLSGFIITGKPPAHTTATIKTAMASGACATKRSANKKCASTDRLATQIVMDVTAVIHLSSFSLLSSSSLSCAPKATAEKTASATHSEKRFLVLDGSVSGNVVADIMVQSFLFCFAFEKKVLFFSYFVLLPLLNMSTEKLLFFTRK